MSAAEAWQEWASRPAEETNGLGPRAAFMAGYRRALEDAADDIEQSGSVWQPHMAIIAGMLRARAAAVAPRETKD